MKSSEIEKKIADITINRKEILKGFKILGLFPFYLSYIRCSTHVDLVVIRSQIQKIAGGVEGLDAFYNGPLMSKIQPLINSFCITGLINSRLLGFVLKPFIRAKIKECTHRQVLDIYTKIIELSDAGFFLTYWNHLKMKNHTVLKEEKQ